MIAGALGKMMCKSYAVNRNNLMRDLTRFDGMSPTELHEFHVILGKIITLKPPITSLLYCRHVFSPMHFLHASQRNQAQINDLLSRSVAGAGRRTQKQVRFVSALS